MKALKLIAAGVAVVVLAAPALGQGDVAPLSNRLPAKSLLYVGWGGTAPNEAKLEATGVGRLLSHEEVKPHVDEALKQLQAFIQAEMSRELPPEVFGPLRDVLTGVVLQRPWALSLIDVKLPGPEQPAPVIDAALVVDLGDDAQKLSDSFDKLVARTIPPGLMENAKVVDVGGAKLKSLQPEPDAPVFFWGTHKGHLLITLGRSAAEQVVARLGGGEAVTLASAEQFATVTRQVGPGLLNVYMDVARFRTDYLPMLLAMASNGDQEEADLANRVAKALGTDDLDAFGFSLRTDGADFVHNFYLLTPRKKSGLLVLADQKPLATGLVATVPADATFAVLANVNRVQVLDELEKQLGTLPEVKKEFDKMKAEIAKATGLDLRNNLAEAMGDGVAIYNAPSTGGFLLTGLTVVAEVKNPGRLKASLAKLEEFVVAQLNQELGEGKARVREAAFDGGTYRYLDIAAKRSTPSPVAPAWTVHEGRFVFALYPQTLRGALAQIKRGKEGSLLTHDEFVARLAADGNGASTIVHINSDQLLRIVYPAALPLWQVACSMAAEEGVKLDVNMLPRQELLVEYLNNDFAAVVPDPQGVKITSRGPLPLLSPASLGTVAPLAGAVALPAIGQARTAAKRAQGMANLAGWGNVLAIYQSQKNKYPDSLQACVDEDFATPESLRAPQAPEMANAYTYIKPQGEHIKATRIVVIYEDPAVNGGDGGNVLYMDGHVQWHDAKTLRERVEWTHKQWAEGQRLE